MGYGRAAVLAAALGILALTTPHAIAQAAVESNLPGAGFDQADTVPPTSSTPTLKVYSRETIVDVLVTDDKGQQVRGLTRSDFTVEEDGKPQPIHGFYEYDKQAPPAPVRTLPPNTYTNDNTLPANGPVQIFLFDLLGTPPAVMQRAKQYIADYFRTMPAGTQVALFEFSPSKGTVLLQGFTTDGAAAAKVVDNLDVEWSPIRVLGYPIAIAGLHQTAAYVAGIHGRKNLIWIKPGSPLPVVHDGGYSWPNASHDMTYVHQFMDLYDIFTREQIAISSLDPRVVHEIDNTIAAGYATLMDQAIADETGGAPIGNSNDFRGDIARIVSYSAHGYTLSYVPTRPDEDGHFHPIKITVDRPGLKLSYRTGYNDEQPDPPNAELVHDMIQGPMRLGAIPATQILFDLHVQAGTSAAQPATTAVSSPAPPQTKGAPYDTVFTLDPKQLTLIESPDGTRTTSIEIDLGAYDFYGTLVAARSQTFKISVTPEQFNGFFQTPLKLSLPIDLPRGQLALRAGVFDTAANKAGTLEIPVTVAKPPAQHAAVGGR
jgi:VWFA-related protein